MYDVNQPDYLVLNNPCGELSLFPFETEADQPAYAVGLYDWAVARGYRWVGDRCAIDPLGQPIEPHHFLPRRLMGEYLQWFYRALLASAPRGIHIIHHPTAAVDLVARRDGGEEVRLANGGSVVVDHVIVTSGHTANEQPDETGRDLEPYPVGSYADALPAGSTVAVSGMGLVAVDIVTALTIGRGGEFVENWRGIALPTQRTRAADPAVLQERSPVHRQVGDRQGPQRRLQAGDLHHRGARRAQRPLEWAQATGGRAA